MNLTLIWIALLFALLDWIAVARGWKVVEYIAKPAVMVCLIAWLGVNGGWSGALLWFTAGLVFSMAGDVFLMLPKERFVAGLVSFLLAHVAYVIGLNTTPLPMTVVTIIILVIVGLVSTRLFLRISQGLAATGNSKLKIPVLAYTIVISLMLFSALLAFVRPSWSPGAALLTPIAGCRATATCGTHLVRAFQTQSRNRAYRGLPAPSLRAGTPGISTCARSTMPAIGTPERFTSALSG